MTILFTDIGQLVQPHPDAPAGQTTPLEITPDAALLVEAGKIVAAGARTSLESAPEAQAATRRVSLGGRAVVPGLVDSHTHLVFAGHRIDEMDRRCRGETYETIARAGGGILSSVEALRAATPESLLAQSSARLAILLARGTTTCEIKTGYGLTPELELKQLQVIEALAGQSHVQIVATILAHVVPPGRRGERAAYIDDFVSDLLEVASRGSTAQLVRHCDVFVEEGAFSPDEARRIAGHARALGLALKLHVDQLRDGGGAALAAQLGALSADHLEHTSPAGAHALAQAGVVATILPGCKLFLGKGPWPPARALRAAGCEVAVATDCNPGSSPMTSLLLAMNMACTFFRMTPEEVLAGATRIAAGALGLEDRGVLAEGMRADLAIWDVDHPAELAYRVGFNPLHLRIFGGAA